VPIHTVLRHRAEVRRADSQIVDGERVHTWGLIEPDLPCLLSITGAQNENLGEGQVADRSGVLFALPSVLRPNDRLTMTRGAAGTFRVLSAPAQIFNLNALSHCEFRVEEVAS
jgi:hypothetical protein